MTLKKRIEALEIKMAILTDLMVRRVKKNKGIDIEQRKNVKVIRGNKK